MAHSHQSLFGHVRPCTCGFHTQKVTLVNISNIYMYIYTTLMYVLVTQQPTTASTAQGPTGQQAAAVAQVSQGTVGQQAAAVAHVSPGTVGQQAAAVGPTLPGTVGQRAGSQIQKQRPLLNLSMVFGDLLTFTA